MSLTKQQLVALGILGILLLGAYAIIRPFLIAILWAAILVYSSWPLYRRLSTLLPTPPILTSLVMTTALILLLLTPAVLIGLSLSQEIASSVEILREFANSDPESIVEKLQRIPWIGNLVASQAESLLTDPKALRTTLVEAAQGWSGALQDMVGGAARNIFKLGITLLTLFFFYHHGNTLVNQIKRVTGHLGGEHLWSYMLPITQAVNAVLYGLILTALAQGLLAGIGYTIVGLPGPALLGAVTGLLALIPFGAPIIWGPAGGVLLYQGDWLAGIGILLWGFLVVGLVDNLIRPVVISASTRIPFLLVFFGVIGGTMAFGLIGLFIGPIILSVLLTVWREWTEANE